MNVYPSILTDQVEEVFNQVNICKNNSLVQTVQVDIVDGFFADNITVFPEDISSIDFGDLSIDFHLMTQSPMDFVHEIIDSKDSLPVRGVIGQLEQMGSQTYFLQEVKKYGWLAGLSLNLHTPLESIDDDSWQHLDLIQIMSIRAGFQGQNFNNSIFNLVSEVNSEIEKRNLNIEVIIDGGVKLSNIKEIESYGVDGVAVGSALWNKDNFDNVYKDFLS